MSCSLSPDRAVAHEVRRIADEQLARALEGLRGIGTAPRDEAVREARRRVDQLRALLLLVRPALGEAYIGASRRLRRASRMLAPVADGRALIETFDGLEPLEGDLQSAATLVALRAALQKRAAHQDRKAELERALPKARRILMIERTRIGDWTLNAGGVRAIARGLARTARRARDAMREAVAHPTAANHAEWRRHVGALSCQLRLIDARCGHGLALDRRRAASLDACLVEYQLVVRLERILMREAIAPRGDTTRGLRLLRRRQLALRHRAIALARRAGDESPREFVDRMSRLWRRRRQLDAQPRSRRRHLQGARGDAGVPAVAHGGG
jgi:hypothetical protein